MSSFYSLSELASLNLYSFGKNVSISRFARIYNPQNLKIGSNVRIDDFCVISAGSSTTIGNYVHIASFVGLWGNRGLVIGDYCGISIGSRILTENDTYDGTALLGGLFPSKYRKLVGQAMHIHPFVNIGIGVTVLPVPELAEGVVIGANSLVTKPLAPWTINAGIPAKFIKHRAKNMIAIKEEMFRQF